MAFQVVCVSRTLGAKGEAVGQTVAQRLAFRYVDEHIITRAAELAQVDPRLVAAVEHRQPLLQRVLDKLAAAQELVGPLTLTAGIPLDVVVTPEAAGPRTTAEDARALIRAAIHEVANAGRAVIVAHAASMALAFAGGVLRVLITASPETRARRIAVASGIPENAAAATIAASDREREGYFRQFYKIRDELPTHYDLVINTDVLTPEQAAEIVVVAAGS
jgi:CMP/dCMP kinase